MREVEVKILDIDVEAVRKRLLELGATKVFDGDVDFIMFDYPDGRIRSKNEHFRLRKIGDKVELVHKSSPEPVEGFKIRKETETCVEDFDTMIEILKNVGFFLVLVMILLNNREYPWSENLTIKQVLEANNYIFPDIVVKINGVFIPEDEYANATVNDGDDVLALHIFGGG